VNPPMHSRYLHDKLRLSLNHPRWRLGSSTGNQAAFLFTYWTEALIIRAARVGFAGAARLFQVATCRPVFSSASLGWDTRFT
jgi:hypothetical protein